MGLQRPYADGPFLHPDMKIKYILAVFAAIITYACAPSVRTRERSQPATDVGSIPTLSSTTSWIISPTRERQRYRSITSTLLELADTTGITRDSVTTTTDFSLSVARDQEPLTYSAIVESMSARGGFRAGITTTTELPFAFTAHVERGRIIVDSPSGQTSQSYTDCSRDALSTTAVIQRAVIILLPLTLRKDMTWTDSTTASICSGFIPVTSTTIRHYRVMGEVAGSVSGILLERQDRTTLSGEGSQGQHRIRLKSDGAGTTQLFIDLRTGAMIESNGIHTASVIVTASGRDQKFTQRTREQILRRLN